MRSSAIAIRHATAAKTGPGKSLQRLDIQGLRALAVLSVVADHLFKFPAGGFVGVDVFFVISGFLITGLLIKEHARSGRISFLDFYRRRIRRITPVAVLVLAVTVAASWSIYTATRAQAVAVDAIWSFFFAANWHLALVGTDYMQNQGPVSPLQHYWSLAVEEQYYMVWPIVMVVILGFGFKSERQQKVRKTILLTALVLLTAGSFVWAMHESATSPSWAYFSTVSRAWELGVGAILAASVGLLARIPQAIRPTLGWSGFAGIIASLFVITPESTFPAPWAALPVLSTALVIVAGTGSSRDFLKPLTNRVAGYIGDISYSLYLWHWPVIILLTAYVPATQPIYFYLALAMSVGLSVLSYHFVEDTIRRSSWLDVRRKRGPRARRPFRRPRMQRGAGVSNKAAYIGLAVLAVITGGTSLLALTPQETPSSAAYAAAPKPSGFANAAAPKFSPAVQGVQDQIAASLTSTAWPELSPSLDALGNSSWAPEVYKDRCLTVPAEKWGVDCVYGDKKSSKVAVVLGDSMAASWMPAIRGALEPQGYRIEMLTRSACPVFAVTLANKDQEACGSHRAASFAYVAEHKPALVIVANLDSIGNTVAGKDVAAAMAEWETGGRDSLSKFGTSSKIVMLSVPPRGPNLNDCAVAGSTPQTCTAQISDFWWKVTAREKAAVEAEVKANVPVHYVDVSNWFCTPTAVCPPYIGNHPVRVDGIHMVGEYTATLSAVMAEALHDDSATAP
ncbi:acyltransferase family protein [Pseudarthrobacter sp. NIBRBAC000502770]|uniref:acyltransferase family protein n=1 Tax=Pseudarthrobacter sp. NIBRBAC000502770 TaxID=2590785 RepID=UPI0011408103|nr:acyltransferase family protein [Pseudarthrobacter sp. NIBRBAC000502770]QDG89409.1 acyltransferase [Pseudarthrobacter sp. NIBRBAC000502770]